MEKCFDSSIAPSFKGALSVRLVVEGVIIIMIPLVVLFLFGTVSFLVPVFDPATGISIADHIAQVTVIPASPSTTFLRWRQSTGRV
jgi:hypothetical protein